ncbi:MAG: tetratricopeptide repeat protein [Deltaproteobacteria bacterium]|jgi:golgin subfamily B member 1|nr:tetratricopeptide repeat protein [Deltaproteobacteria bacterium]
MAELDAHLDRLDESPDDAQALSAVEEIYAKEGQLDELAKLYDVLAAKVEPAMAANLWVRGANLYIESLEQPARAEPYLKQALHIDPSDLEASKILRELYFNRGALTEGVELYEKQLRAQAASPDTSDGWVEIAKICVERLKDHGRGLNALDEAIGADALNPEPYRIRGMIHQERGRPRLVFDSLLNELRVGGLDEERLVRLRELTQEMVKKPRLHALAAQGAEKLAEIREDDPVALTVQHDLELCRKDWKQKVLELDGRAMHLSISDEKQAAGMWLEVAELQLAYGEHRDAALVSLDKALGASPGDEEGLALLRDVYEENGRYGALAEELEKMAGTVKSEAQSIELSFQAAQLYEEELGNTAGAARLYRQVLEKNPESDRATDKLANYYLENKQPEEAIRVLEKLAQNETVGNSLRVAARMRMANICENSLDDSSRGLLHFEEILGIEPTHKRACAALEEAYRAEGQEEGLARLLVLRMDSVEPRLRMSMMQELGSLYANKLEKFDEAIELWGELYEAAAGTKLREEMEALATTGERAQKIAESLAQGVQIVFDPELKKTELEGLARFQEFVVEDHESALATWRTRIPLGEQESEGYESVSRLLMRLAPQDQAAEYFRAQIQEAVDPLERVATLHLLAGALLELEDSTEAADVWRRILDIEPADASAFHSLSEYLRDASEFSELIQRHESRIANLEIGEESGVACRDLAQILEESGGEPEDAAGWYIKAVEDLGDDALCVEALERMFDQGVWPLEIAKTLEPLFSENGNHAGEARMLEVLVEDEKVDFAAADMWRRLLELYDTKLDDRLNGYRCAAKSFGYDSRDEALADTLLRLSDAPQEHLGSRDAFRAVMPKLKAEMLQRMALRAAKAGVKTEEPALSLGDLLYAYGSDEESRQGAAALIRELVPSEMEAEALYQLAEAKEPDLNEATKRSMWIDLGRGFEEPWDHIERAVDSWEKVRDLPSMPDACIPALDRLYEQLGDHEKHATYLQSRFEEDVSAEDTMSVGRRLIEVLADELERYEEAIVCAEQLAEVCPDEQWIWARLVELYFKTSNPEGVLEAYASELPLIDDDEERRIRALDYARGFGLRLGDHLEAERILRRVFTEEPGHGLAREACQELYQANDRGNVKRALGSMWIDETERAGDYQPLVDFCENHVSALEAEVHTVPLLTRMATWYDSQLDNGPSALDCLTRAFSLRPRDLRLEESWMEQADKVGDWQTVLNALEALCEHSDASSLARFRGRRANVFSEKLEDLPSAIDELLRLGDPELPADVPSLKMLCDLSRRANRPSILADALEEVFPKWDDAVAKERLGVCYELAEVCETELKDFDRARAALRLAQKEDRDPLRALRWQERLLADSNNTDALLLVLNDLVDPLVKNPDVRKDLLKKGRLEHQLGSYAEALECYKRALEHSRHDEEAIAGLEALVDQAQCVSSASKILEPIYTIENQYEKLAWLLGHRLDEVEDKSERKHLLRRLGELVDTQLEQPERAFEFGCQALEVDPADAGLRMWLESLAERAGAQEALAELYSRMAPELPEPLNLQYHRRAAERYHHELKDLPAAVKEYRAIVTLKKTDDKSLTGLESIFKELPDYPSWIEILRLRIENEPGRERKVGYLREIALIYADGLGDKAAVAKTYRELYDFAPESLGTFDALEQVYLELEDNDGLLELYVDERRRLLEQSAETSMEDWLDLTTRQAKLHYKGFDDSLSAVALLREVFEDEPDYPEADRWVRSELAKGDTNLINFLDERYSKRADYEDLADVLEVKLRNLVEPVERRDLLIRIANLRERELGQPRQALGALGLAIRECPGDVSLLDKMWELGNANEMWRDASSLIRKSLREDDPELRFQWYFRLAECARDKLDDMGEAVACFEVCVETKPANLPTLEALDPLYGQQESWKEQVDTKEKLLTLISDKPRRAELLLSLSFLYDEKLEQSEAARKSCARLVEEQPAHLIGLEREAELFRGAQLWSPLEKNLRMQLAARTDLSQLVALHRELAGLYDEHLEFPARAVDSWRELLVIESNDGQAQEQLDRLFSEAKRFPELLDHLAYMLEHGAKGEDISDLYLRRARLFRDQLEQPEQAEQDWQQLLEREPEQVEALESLANILHDQRSFEPWAALTLRRLALPDDRYCERKIQLIEVLGKELDRVQDASGHAQQLIADDRTTWEELAKLATLCLELNQPEHAIEALTQATKLCDDPEQKRLLLYRLVEIYNDVVNNPIAGTWAWEALWSQDKTDLRPYPALQNLYEQAERWQDLVELHEAAMSHLGDDETVSALQAILSVQSDKLEMPERAFMTAGRLYRLKPEDLSASQSLIDLGLSLGCADEAVAILEDQLDDIRDSRIRLSRLMQVGELYHTTLKDLDEAEGAYERALEIDPEHIPALDGLLKVAIDDERFDKQLAALERKQVISRKPEAKKPILAEMGRIWEQEIGDESRAVSIYQRILELMPDDQDALIALSRLYAVLGNHEALADVLARRVEQTTDLEQGIELRMKLARLWSDPLNDAQESIRWLDSVLILDGENRETWTLLEAELRKVQGKEGLRDLFVHQLSVLEEPAEKVAVLRKLANVHEELFENLESAADCLEDVLQLEPTHLEVVGELESLLRRREDWPRLITIMDHHLRLLSDPDEKAQVYLDMGEVYHSNLARVDLAEQAYNQVRVLKPESPVALHALGQLYERSGNWFQALDMLEQEAQLTQDKAEASKLYQRMGRIQEQMLMNREGAAEAYRRALELDVRAIVAIESLKSMASDNEDWGSYIRYLKMEIDVTDDDEDRFELHVEAADYYDRVEEDDLKALEQLELAIDIEPADVDCTSKLAEYHFRNEGYEQAGQYYRRLLNLTDGSSSPAEICHRKYRLGYTYERLEDLDNALRSYQEAVQADPSYLAAQEALAQMLLSSDQHELARDAFQRIIEEHREELTASEVVDIHWQLGDLELKAGRLPNARSGYEKALELDPNHVLSLKALADIDCQMGQWDQAYERLDRYSRLIPLDTREPVYLKMADIAQSHLGDSAKELEPLVRGARLDNPSVDLLEKLANVLLARSDFQQAGAVLKKAAGSCEDITRRASLLHRLGGLYETKLGNEPLALKAYHMALDLEPTRVDAFKDMERLLVKRQEWQLLEECYRAMLGRAQALTPTFRLVLWRNLAELYDRALKDVDNAIMAYEVVRQLDQSRESEAQRLSELYLKSPKHRQKAIEIGHEIYDEGQDFSLGARKLKELYHAQSHFDGVFVYCGILDGLGTAGDDEYKMLEHLKKGIRPWPQRPLGEDGWQAILAPELHGPVGDLAAELARLAPDAFTQSPKSLGLKKKEFVSLDSELYLAGMLRRVHGALSLSAPGLYIRKGSMEPAHLAPSSPPALVVGQNNSMTQTVDASMSRFLLGYQLSFMRPELFLTGLYPGEQLRELLMGLCVVYNRSLGGAEHAGVAKWASHFEKIPGEVLRALQEPARRAYSHLLSPEPTAGLAKAAHLSAARAGLLLAGELGPALRGLQIMPATAPGLSPELRLLELTRFAGSKQHLRLREKIGSGLDVSSKNRAVRVEVT